MKLNNLKAIKQLQQLKPLNREKISRGKYLNETAGKAIYKTQVLIPLWASG